MKFYILFLFLYVVSIRPVVSQLQHTISPEAIHIYHSNSTTTPIVSFPTTSSFIEAASVKQKINVKLGSFHYGRKKYNNLFQVSSYHIHQTDDNNIQMDGIVSGNNKEAPFQMMITALQKRIHISLHIENEQINETSIHLLSSSDEMIFGGGEQYSHINLKGKNIPLTVEEQGIGRGDKGSTFLASLFGAAGHEFSSYAPIPFFLTTKNRSFFIPSSTLGEAHFSAQNMITFSCRSNSFETYVWSDENPLSLLTVYTEESGRMPLLPDFAYGTILGLQGGKDRVEQIINQLDTFNPTMQAIWIQDWVGKRKTSIGSRLQWDWTYDEKTYPDLPNWIDSLHKKGIHTLGYINPYLVEDGMLTQEALENEFVVNNKHNKPYLFKAGGFKAYMLDLTNPNAYTWMKSIIKQNMIDIGFDGWMADFSEWLPMDAVLHSGISPIEYHNQYSVDWVQLNREAIQETNNEGKIFFFNRAGYAYSNKYATAFWAGDQMANFGKHDGLPSAICALNSSGLSGIAINHTDIGGYTAIHFGPWKFLRSKEVLFRWIEMAAFTPIFRTHEGLRPDEMVQFYSDEETLSFFSRFSDIHDELFPYLKSLNQDASNFGWPMIRHPYLHFPHDTNTYHLVHQFMLGDQLMVIPVIEASSQYVDGYLPEGEWEHYFTGEIFSGNQFYRFHAPVGLPAVFKRK